MNLPYTRALFHINPFAGSIYLVRFLFANRNDLNQVCVCGKGLLTLLPHYTHTHTFVAVHVVRKINIQAKSLRHTITSNECYYQKIRKVLFFFNFFFHCSFECKTCFDFFFGQLINHLWTKPLEIGHFTRFKEYI